MRFRPPRPVLTLSLTLTLAAAMALAWLGWKMLQQEAALEVQRSQDRLESAADRAVSLFQREIADLDRYLSPASNTPFPESTVAFSADRRTIRVAPPGGLVYLPSGVGPAEPPDEVFRAGEVAEFGPTPEKSIPIYRELANAPDQAVQAGALLRLGRALRKAKHFPEARQTYSRLITLGPVRTSGLPAALIGREARCTLLDEIGDGPQLSREAGDLCRELASGAWPIAGPAWVYLREEARKWLGEGTACATVPDSALTLAAAAGLIWSQRPSLPTTGHKLLLAAGRPVLAHWAGTRERLSVVLAGESFLENLCRRVARETGTQIALATESGQPFLGRFAAEVRARATRSAAATRLPWTLQVASADPATENAQYLARRRMLLAGFAITSALLLAGGYFTFRGIRRELAVAQLQSDFVSAVSHEFRTPLTSLRMLSELLSRGRTATEERRHQYYEAMTRDTQRLQRLVEGLLNFGRMESGAMRYSLDRIDAREWVRTVAAEFERQLEDGHIELSLPEAQWALKGDQEALSLALWNLLDNAFKYSPDCRTVWVDLARDGARVAIAVRDQGIGIPRDEQRRIFGKFVRGSAAGAGVKGTGVGLALVAHVAKAHHGEVKVASEPGKGSTFTLLLPAENGIAKS